MKQFSAALLLLLTSDWVRARDHAVVTETQKQSGHKRPHVEELNCRFCLIDNPNAQVCITYGGNWQLGWDNEQEWYDDNTTVDEKDGWYKLAFNLYSSQSVATALLIDIDRLFYLNTEIEIDEFEIQLFFGGTYYYLSRRFCIDSYTTFEDFLLTLLVQLQFIECYKDIIHTFWDWNNWTGLDAKILDSCRMSSIVNIQPYEKDFNSANWSQNLIGNQEDDSLCVPGWLF